jgi:hypothetical protein
VDDAGRRGGRRPHVGHRERRSPPAAAVPPLRGVPAAARPLRTSLRAGAEGADRGPARLPGHGDVPRALRCRRAERGSRSRRPGAAPRSRRHVSLSA